MKEKFKSNRILKTYLLVSILNILAVFVALFVTNGQFLSEIVWDARHDLFVDFTYVQGDRRGQAGYVFFRVLGQFIPDNSIAGSLVDRWAELFCVILIVLCVVAITLLIQKYLNESLRITFLFSIVFFVSAPFAFACVKAGNTLFISLTVLLAAMYLREQESLLLREIALICIAFAADLKLAPAVFGLIYLREKRYKEAIRLLIYGCLFVIIPPIVTGGIDIYLSGFAEHSGLLKPRPETIIGVFLEGADIIGLTPSVGLILGKVASYCYLSICVILFFLSEETWKIYCLLTSLLIVFINMSYPYTLCYLLIPLLYFIKAEKKEKSLANVVYAALFAFVLNAYPIIRIDWPTATFITNYFFLYIMLVVLIIDVTRNIIHNRKVDAICEK